MSYLTPSPYILLQLPDITDSINYPVKNVQRIKYTCFDVSKSLIAFGATSGGIYVFNRTPCEFVQLIPNKDGAITRLSISGDDKHIGFANGRGIVTVMKCEQTLSGVHSAVTSKEHQGNEVTAMAWSGNMLFTGDDVGKIAVLQLQNFIAKTMFQSSSQTIMNLDSRICQIDVKSCMVLVSTLTRCYICDTSYEQYRQIGQKLRDGEFGACFLNKEKHANNLTPNNSIDFSEVKEYNIVNDDSNFASNKELQNTLIFCARPSSRLWEVTIDGDVKRTHQFKQVLARKPMKLVSIDSYQNENVLLNDVESDEEGRSINFAKIFSVDGAIFSFKRDSLYFLTLDNVNHSLWFDTYKDIVDCKVYYDMVYVWLSDGSLLALKFMKFEKFLLKCYLDEKYTLCADMCAFFKDYLLSNSISNKLHILNGLKDKIEDKEIISKINTVLLKFSDLKSNEATQLKSGIYVVDNTYHTQTALLNDLTKNNDEYKLSLPPEAIQTLKDLSLSVTDKLHISKKILKEKWEDFEERMKHLSTEKQPLQEIQFSNKLFQDDYTNDLTPVITNEDIVYKESSQKAIEIDNTNNEKDKASKSLYYYFQLSLVGKENEESNLVTIIESYACDISEIYTLMLSLEQYCISIRAFEESKYVPNNIFLTYLTLAAKKDEYLNKIISDDVLYKYFVDSCISVNVKTQKVVNGCECGFPLPYARMNHKPVFSELIDEFIERQWSNQTRDQCYDVCKRMPYLWRKILYLRRNEDLQNILRLLLQMLDENLLHTFLPQFTLDIWNRAVQLYATLHANMCLNCSKKFNHISVKDTLSWDDLGALMIKSIGGRNSIKIMERNAGLIDAGAITVKFYHTCLMVTMFEKYDSTIVGQLTDTLYRAYENADAKTEICSLLRNSLNGQVENTALPLLVAAMSTHWGLKTIENGSDIKEESNQTILDNVLDNLNLITNGNTDCTLCGLPLKNEVLIKDGGLWVFKCGHTFHGSCLNLNKVKLCPFCIFK